MRSTILTLLLWSLASALHPPTFIKSPRITSWGSFSAWEDCPAGYYAHGMRIKYESEGQLDNTALNAVELACKSPAITGSNSDFFIKGDEAKYGTWQRYQYCSAGEYAIGFALQAVSPRSGWQDDIAANNFALYCGKPDGPRRRSTRIIGTTSDKGSWSGDQFCPAGQLVCGIQVQLELSQSVLDDTAVNNVDLKCCDFLSMTTSSMFPWKK